MFICRRIASKAPNKRQASRTASSVRWILLGSGISIPVLAGGLELQEQWHEAAKWLKDKMKTDQPETGLSPSSMQGYAARWMVEWCALPERAELAVALGGNALLDWLLESATAGQGTAETDPALPALAERALTYLLESDQTAATVAARPGAVPRLILKHTADGGLNPDTIAASPLLSALLQRALAGLQHDTPSHDSINLAGNGPRCTIVDLTALLELLMQAGHVNTVEPPVGWQFSTSAPGDRLATPTPPFNTRTTGSVGSNSVSGSTDSTTSSTGGSDSISKPAGVWSMLRLPSWGLPWSSRQSKSDSAVSQGTGTGIAASVSRDARALQHLAAAWLASWAEAHESNRAKLSALNAAALISRLVMETSGQADDVGARALQLQLIRLVEGMSRGRSESADTATHADAARDSSRPHTAAKNLAALVRPMLFVAADAAAEHDAERGIAALKTLQALLRRGGEPVAGALGSQPVMALLQRIVLDASSPEDLTAEAVRAFATLVRNPWMQATLLADEQLMRHWRSWLIAALCRTAETVTDPPSALGRECVWALSAMAKLPGIPGIQVTHIWLAELLAALASQVWPDNAPIYLGGEKKRPKVSSGKQRTSRGVEVVSMADLVDAVPVLPAQIKAVALALEAASAAAEEEHEPPDDFDYSGFTAAMVRESYRHAAHTVDLLPVERRVCEALEGLCALVAADPAKQRFLAAGGILPLLQRLLHAPSAYQQSPPPTSTLTSDDQGSARAAARAAVQALKHFLIRTPDKGGGPPLDDQQLPGLPVAPGDAPGLMGPSQDRDLPSQDADTVAALAVAQLAEPTEDINNVHAGLGKLSTCHENWADNQLSLRRQVARLLAMLAMLVDSHAAVEEGWSAWLTEAAQSEDCRLSSHAQKALLNLAALRPNSAHTGHDPGAAPVYQDQIHLLDPAAPHLWRLAAGNRPPGTGEQILHTHQPGHGAATDGLLHASRLMSAGSSIVPDGWAVSAEEEAAPPDIDVVFIHGIRGGPFITWRKPGAALTKVAFMPRSSCWPTDWLAADVPNARMLTVEYLAPVSSWEGESLPLEATVERVMSQLVAAGVGQRPLVFVAHSMGGLLVKEMLMRSLRESEAKPSGDAQLTPSPHMVLAQACKGIVFFATPHFGSQLAQLGWKLPPFCPAPALAKLTPGPHLVELNDVLVNMVAQRGLLVTSVVEGRPTVLSPVIPAIMIVPEGSGYPGAGALTRAVEDDHITLCKPASQEAPAYQIVLRMLQEVLRQAGESPGLV